MPRGDKSAYTDKQKREAEHIEDSYQERGLGKKEAERRAWATVNKETGGGKKGKSASAKKPVGKKTAPRSAAKKKAVTRRAKSKKR